MKKWMTTLVLMVACSTFVMTGCGETSLEKDSFEVAAQELHQVSYERTKPSGQNGIAYRVIGNGAQDIVLVHGWGVSSAVYDNMIAELAGPANRIIAIDLRGTGDSFKPSHGNNNYKLEKYYDDVKDVIKHANATNFILVGHSMGGAIAQLYASKDNQACKEGKSKKCVKGLVLMSPVPASGFPLDAGTYGLFEASGEDLGLRRLILSISSPGMTQQDIDHIASAADSMPAIAVTQSLAAWTGADFANKLRKIKAPTMVMVSDDPFMPVAFLQQSVVDPISNATMNYFPGSGHYLQVEDPVRTAAEIQGFIDNLDMIQETYEFTKPVHKKGIGYRVSGNGPQDVVLVHGWSVSGAVYDNLLAELEGPDYRIITIDLRGAGQSFKPGDGYTLDNYYKDVKDVIQHSKAKNFVLVGHSMGGAIAQQYAYKQNDECKVGKRKTCVKGLVLMSPVPASGFPLDAGTYGLFEASGADPNLRRLILSISSPDMTAADLEYVASAADSIPAIGVTQSLAAWTGADFANKLNKIKAPTMVMVSDDPFMPVSFLQQMVADPISDAFVNYFPGSGHYLQVEDPVTTAVEMTSFIESLP